MEFFRVRELNINNQLAMIKEMEEIGVDKAGISIMKTKGVHRVLKVEGLSTKAANILKQEMLARGGEAAVSRQTICLSADKTDVLLMGTVKQYQLLIKKLYAQPFKLKSLAEEIADVLHNLEVRQPYQLKMNGKTLTIGERTLVMGILNVTPDSFSDGGRFFDLSAAIAQAKAMVAEGADIIDVGGESTRPSHTPIPAAEELRRIIPVIKELAQEITVPISVDTYKAEVASECLAAGADIINDVWGLQRDPDMAKVAAERGAPVVVMHNQYGTEYRDLMGDILDFLKNSIDQAESAGVAPEHIIVDPGIGFGKTTDQNLEVMNRLDELKALGKAILLGTSRKSMIGNTLNLPLDERVEGTAATVVVGITKGADIVRVHDVKEMVRVVRMTDAMVRR